VAADDPEGSEVSEQDAASVDQFLDDLDTRSDLVAAAQKRRRDRAAAPAWEYMTWTTTDTKTGRSVRLVDGERLAEYRPEPSALVEAGAQGWELVAVVPAGGRQDYTLYFKRPKVED
jgi:hypothetical protein